VRDDEPIVDAAVEDLAAAAAALPDDALPDTAQVDAPSFDAAGAAQSIADDLRDFPDDDGDDNVDAVECGLPGVKPEGVRVSLIGHPDIEFVAADDEPVTIEMSEAVAVTAGIIAFTSGQPLPEHDGTEGADHERNGWEGAWRGFLAHRNGRQLAHTSHGLSGSSKQAWSAGWAEREEQHGAACDQRSPHEASEAGRRSLLFGAEISECPHKDPALRKAWVAGWHAGRDEQLADLWERWLTDGACSNIRLWDMSPGPALMDVEQAKMGARAEVHIERQIKKMQELLPIKEPAPKVETPTTPAPIADIEESDIAKRTRRLSEWLAGWPQAALDAQELGARITLTLDSDRDQ